MMITLEAWAESKFNPPPAIRTLRAWRKSGWISPAPVKVGRGWMVDEHAEYCPSSPPMADTANLSPRVLAILRDVAA